MSEQRDDIITAPSITDLRDQAGVPVRWNRGILLVSLAALPFLPLQSNVSECGHACLWQEDRGLRVEGPEQPTRRSCGSA